jgi:hypothetical protein
MKKLFLFLMVTFLFFGICNGQASNQMSIDNFPYIEGFENNGSALPVGWIQEIIVPTEETCQWVVRKAGEQAPSIEPKTVHGGQYKAFMDHYWWTHLGSKVMLIPPVFDFSAIKNPTLKFWHTQRSWGPIDVLRIYCKTSATGAWVLLEEYLEEVYDWTERTIPLKNPSATYYIAFEGEINGGRAVQLDDVMVFGDPYLIEAELKAILQPVSGENLSAHEQVTISIKNRGVNALTNFGIELKLGETVEATETYFQTITTGAEVEYTFNKTLDLSAEGTFIITVTLIVNGDEIPENNSKTIQITNTHVSINESNIAKIQLYPNPFNNEIHISHPELVKNVQITNIMGQVIERVVFNGKYITTENLSSGFYFVTVENTAFERTVIKMIKN